MPKKLSTFVKLKDLQKKGALNEKLGLDERDTMILSLIQQNPNLSQAEIAKKIKLSQPSVGARIKKLQDKGILYAVNGVNFKIVNLSLAKVDVNTTSTTEVLNEFKDCPFFVNGLVTSGRYNLTLLFMATDIRNLERIVDTHLRSNSKVKDLELNVVISTVRDFVLPLNVNFDNMNQNKCEQRCMENAWR